MAEQDSRPKVKRWVAQGDEAIEVTVFGVRVAYEDPWGFDVPLEDLCATKEEVEEQIRLHKPRLLQEEVERTRGYLERAEFDMKAAAQRVDTLRHGLAKKEERLASLLAEEITDG